MYASNAFPSGIGKTYLRQITREIHDVLNGCTKTDLVKLRGIGPVRSTKILEGLEQFHRFMECLPN